jgi:glycosyltransferase involved in cell wall biosynthesis
MTTVSAVVLTRNEERHLPDCLASLCWADEVLVLDSGSRDHTLTIAQEAGVRIEQRDWVNYSVQRQRGLELARCEWVFFVDADERVPTALADEVRRVLAAAGPEVGWWVPRRNFFPGGREVRFSGWSPDYQLRLLRRDAAHYDPTEAVHEVARLQGQAGWLTEKLVHINYEQWGEFFAKQAAFARHEASTWRAAGQRTRPHNLLLQPLRAFYRRYVTWQGWRDGWLGLWLSLAMAGFDFLSWWYLWRLPDAES